jgi:hypothetical protein
MSTNLGNAAVLSVQTDGVSGSAGYTPFTDIRNVTDGNERTEVDFSTRASDYKISKLGLKSNKLDCVAVYDDEDATLLAIEDAYENNTHIGVKNLNKTGGSGITADYLVQSFVKPQDLEAAQDVSFTLVPTYVDTYPVFA